MELDAVIVHTVTLPFAFGFSHAQRNRSFARNVVVEVVADNGSVRGFGEGAPRSYVTGETPTAAAGKIAEAVVDPAFCWTLKRPEQVRDLMGALTPGPFGNAAWCALELGLLDALGRRLNRSVIDFFPEEHRTETIFYGAALPLAEPSVIEEGCRVIRKLGIERIKLKFGAERRKNAAMLETVRGILGNRSDLKVDVNFAWDYSTASSHIPLLREHGVRLVEQPLLPEDPDRRRLAGEMGAAGIVLMADESACTLADLERIRQEKTFGMINMRLSKCGGFFRSLEMISILRDTGVPFQVACHLGESGILSAAGRALGLLCRDAVYWDGSYDAFLLKENLTTENVGFGAGGKAGPLAGPGLGVEISTRALRRLSAGAAPVVFKRPGG